MRVEKAKDIFVSMVATKRLIEIGHAPRGTCNICGESSCREIGIHPKFLKYNTRSKAQKDAIEYASWRIYDVWKVLLHGAKLDQGNTRNLTESAIGTKNKKARWVRLIEEYDMKIVVSDHVQQYSWGEEPTDYEKQNRAIGVLGDFVSQYGVACFLLSQVSLKALRESRTGGKLTAAGGAKAAQEANTVFSVFYASGSGNMKIKIEEAREAANFSAYQHLEDSSGCFYGPAQLEPFDVF
jgi:hypothetical protein